MRIRRDDAFLLVVDVQQKLAPHVEGHARVIGKSAGLIRAARKLSLPVLVSEHCPELIGSTVPGLMELVSQGQVLPKTHFSCTDEPALFERLQSLKRKQAVVCGMEAHVCVMQTALGLAERGYQPFVVRDAVGSRREEDRATALERLREAGCGMATAEMAIFEWMGRADIPEFRELLGILKAI
jgi:nicotinamidase-related amidase